jgi:hypothetical protein
MKTPSEADGIHSNTRRSRLGVFLRRGACAQESQGVGRAHHSKDQEGCSKGSGKYHVFLLKEVKCETIITSERARAYSMPYWFIIDSLYKNPLDITFDAITRVNVFADT